MIGLAPELFLLQPSASSFNPSFQDKISRPLPPRPLDKVEPSGGWYHADLGLKSCSAPFQAMRSWKIPITSLSLSCLICKMEIILVLLGWSEAQMKSPGLGARDAKINRPQSLISSSRGGRSCGRQMFSSAMMEFCQGSRGPEEGHLS